MKKDYYEILSVSSEATDEEIRTAYLKLALKWHPDKHSGDDSATLKFQQIGEAYRVLSDPVQRSEYDCAEDNYDVDEYALEEYLQRFQMFILTSNGLGLDAGSDPFGQGDLSGFGGLLGVS
mmetsp:Transcript_29578/g.40844  ORF Transcript_29578/g.40844 Transcript_29578/m.40844 type:complete len:121 (-) Transcript_29578:151-513(-)|eukprot:CAMPEP_0196587148 /NCGR_PEP_ID=MMETSP1081-20130531/56583_1 /TAXON_ID=36882 /ORGANISM="Pyramimonas amylifera, Strain CCMP720" /LENGTH=120 /DNA_ID=CAMNT_0041909253 /DNA_START=534 /DNA_END=896 /DNA_ORIENTATION=-